MSVIVACGKSLTLLPLTSDLSCNVLASCTGVQCCATSSTLQRTFEIYINIDPCAKSLSIQIEQLFYNHTLVDFQWGKIMKCIECNVIEFSSID